MQLSEVNRFRILQRVIRISNATVDIDRRLEGLIHVLASEMGVDCIWLYQLDRHSQVLDLRTLNYMELPPVLRFSLEDPFIGRSASERLPVLVAGQGDAGAVFEGFASAAAFPVLDDHALYGVLALFFRQQQEMGQDWVDLMEAVGREMAGTMHNARLYKESKKRIAELSVLYDLARSLSATLEPNQMLNTVVNIICKVLLAEACALNVVDLRTGKLHAAAEYGNVPSACHMKGLAVDADEVVPPKVMSCLRREEPFIGVLGEGGTCGEAQADAAGKSFICLPVRFKGNLKGNITVFNKTDTQPGRPREFNREDLELLATMAAIISSSLENALTFQAVDSLARHNELLLRNLTCLFEISGAMMTTVKTDQLLGIITRALTAGSGLGFDRAVILLVDEDGIALCGAAYREMTLEERGAADGRPLADLLRVEEIEAAGSGNVPEWLTSLELPLAQAGGILIRTVREKRTFIISPDDPEFVLDPGLPDDLGKRWLVTVPMQSTDRMVGVIAVDRDLTNGEATAEDIRNLSMLANQAALAIENSNLYEYIEHANQVLSQTKERLLEAEKLAALGEMAAGMAHEIRNPLVSIGGFTRRLLRSLDKDSPHRMYIEVIINEVTRLEKTLSEVLDFSRDTLGHLDEADLNEIVVDALRIQRREFREGLIEVVRDLQPLPTVMVDERQIKHVFFNLFYNACQAMEKGGQLTVRSFVVQRGDRTFAAVEVADSGPGISVEALPNIFNPFFTTKDSGTGLGLSIVHKIVNRHHGQIDVTNTPGQGAVFTVILPAAAEAGLYLK